MTIPLLLNAKHWQLFLLLAIPLVTFRFFGAGFSVLQLGLMLFSKDTLQMSSGFPKHLDIGLLIKSIGLPLNPLLVKSGVNRFSQFWCQ